MKKTTATVRTGITPQKMILHQSIHSHSFVKFLFIVLFYRKFRLCITNASGKAHTPKIARNQRLPPGGRLFAHLIITQIGRENKFSAEILLLRTVEDACPYKCCVKHPYEKEPKYCGFLGTPKKITPKILRIFGDPEKITPRNLSANAKNPPI